ncbi:methyltransferase domain-containing protein [Candidatus Roizmanbacteria bacterium]|nr:methyltransferase domain-containing protein [Candidatus Roizmanbacteria bacterium]
MKSLIVHPPQTTERIVISHILAIYRALKKLDSLSPSRKANRLFNRLVEITEVFDPSVVNAVFSNTAIQSVLPELRHMCEEGEILFEKYWSHKIQSGTYYKLRSFPDYDNYVELTGFEYNALRTITQRSLSRMLHIGSGALPLTSMCFAQMYKMQVRAIERDPEALALSRSLITYCNLTKQVTILEGDANTWHDFENLDVVLLAAMVGYTKEEKQRTIRNLYTHMKPGQLLLVRTTHSLRSLIYSAIKPEDIPFFTLKAAVHPYTAVRNSVIIAER